MNKIVTYATDAFLDVLEVTRPSMEDYASRIGAELIVDTTDHYPEFPIFNKLDAKKRLQGNRVALIDADIVISPDAPDIFESVPDTHFAAFDEGSICLQRERHDRWNSALSLAEANGVPPPNGVYFNCGVIVLSEVHAGLLTPPELKSNEPMADQSWINIRQQQLKLPYHPLDRRFNYFEFHAEDNWVSTAWFAHAAGVMPIAKRIAVLEAYLNQWLK